MDAALEKSTRYAKDAARETSARCATDAARAMSTRHWKDAGSKTFQRRWRDSVGAIGEWAQKSGGANVRSQRNRTKTSTLQSRWTEIQRPLIVTCAAVFAQRERMWFVISSTTVA